MQPIVTDRVAWSVCQLVSLSGLSVVVVSPAKMAEPVEIPFGLWTGVGPRNHMLDGVQIWQWEGALLRGKGAAHCKVWECFAVSCAELAEPIKMPFFVVDSDGQGSMYWLGCTLAPPDKYH